MGFIGVQPTSIPLTSSDITDGIISTAKIADDAVTSAKIPANAVTDSELNLGSNFAFTGTVSGAGSLNLLLDATISSAVSSYDISNTYINSTYDSYLLDAYFKPSTDNQYLLFRVKVGGTIQTGAKYGYGGKALDGDAEFGDNADTSFGMHMYGCGNADGEGSSLVMHMQNINNSDAPFAFQCQNSMQNTSDNHGGNATCGSLKGADRGDIVNGLSFFWSSGNIALGTVKLYGLKT